MTKGTAEVIVYNRLLANWPKADAILALSLMEIADEIVDDLKKARFLGDGERVVEEK